MRNMLLAAGGTLALALSAAPAAAQYQQSMGFAPSAGSPRMNAFDRSGHWSSDRRDRHHRRGRTDVVLDWYGGEWAQYNNRSWDADSYNDWWHDRPDRAYPRWVTQNQGCERKWFSGDVLHC